MTFFSMNLSRDTNLFCAVNIHTQHAFNQCLLWLIQGHSICSTYFTPKNTLSSWAQYDRGNRAVLSPLEKDSKQSKCKNTKPLFCICGSLFHGWIMQAETGLLLCSKPEVQRTPLHVVFGTINWRLHDPWDVTNVLYDY